MTLPQQQSFSYYNEKPEIQFKEYGRNVENLVKHIVKVEDREERTRLCNTLIALVRKVNPQVLHDTEEDMQKFWDHLHLISGLQLDVDSPYPLPELEIISRKPDPLPYPSGKVKFKHYGQNLELMIKNAIALEDADERKQATIFLARLMKNFYSTWNKDFAEDAIICKQITEMSNGQLVLTIEEVQEGGLFDGVSMSNWKPQTLDDVKSKTGKKRNNRNNGNASNNSNKHGNRRRRR